MISEIDHASQTSVNMTVPVVHRVATGKCRGPIFQNVTSLFEFAPEGPLGRGRTRNFGTSVQTQQRAAPQKAPLPSKARGGPRIVDMDSALETVEKYRLVQGRSRCVAGFRRGNRGNSDRTSSFLWDAFFCPIFVANLSFVTGNNVQVGLLEGRSSFQSR